MRIIRILFVLLLAYSQVSFAQKTIDLVRVIKSKHKLLLLSKNRVIREYKIALGKNPQGHKHQEGDGKTPEGIYVLDYKRSDSAFYKAIHISYPSNKDIAFAKLHNINPGKQVMIHGQKNGLGWLEFITQKFDWTNGCIALSDNDMNELWNLIEVDTKIEIFP